MRRQRTDPNADLFKACQEGDVRAARHALKSGANVNSRNSQAECYPLHAAATGDEEACDFYPYCRFPFSRLDSMIITKVFVCMFVADARRGCETAL